MQEPAVADIRGARAYGIRVVQRVEIPAAGRGEPGNRVRTGIDEVPEVLGCADTAGETTAHADDRDGLGGFLLDLAELLLGLPQVRGQALQVVKDFAVFRHVVLPLSVRVRNGGSGLSEFLVDDVEHVVERCRAEVVRIGLRLLLVPDGQQ
ncbi:hypothetical protein GCM10010434_086830 [Winogradskya humida]